MKRTSNSRGELFVMGPSIGLSLALLNRDHHEVYYQGTPPGPRGELLRRHGDQFELLPGGYFRAQGRADDTMNLGGIKVSSAEIERAVLTVDGVADAAAIAVDPEGGGPTLLVLYLVMHGSTTADALRVAAQKAISSRLNPLFRCTTRVVKRCHRVQQGHAAGAARRVSGKEIRPTQSIPRRDFRSAIKTRNCDRARGQERRGTIVSADAG
jgi:acyl-coenzyme A synthetase/AMP-(fatty) acid ligase